MGFMLIYPPCTFSFHLLFFCTGLKNGLGCYFHRGFSISFLFIFCYLYDRVAVSSDLLPPYALFELLFLVP